MIFEKNVDVKYPSADMLWVKKIWVNVPMNVYHIAVDSV